MRIIPAIDLLDGQCVRLTQGEFTSKKTYSNDPVEVAKSFEKAGAKYLHLVDLDGAKKGSVHNWEIVKGICSETNLAVDFGGGVKTTADVEQLLSLGVQQVNVGSIAVKNEALVFEWIREFGSEKIILSADVKNGFVATHGWQNSSTYTIDEFIDRFTANGLVNVTCTDVERDGMLTGPSFELYEKLLNTFPTINLVASGGIGSLKDFEQLKQVGVFGAITGKALYENKINLSDLLSH